MTINTLNALIEALKAKVPLNKVFLSAAKKDRKVGLILDLCRENNIPMQRVPQETINRKAGPDNQGVFAEMSPIKFYDLDEILESGKSGLILILDSINDTGNMGAMIRSAAAADVDGIIISRHNSAPVNETVLKTSAGTLLKVKIHQARNLTQTIQELKEKGFWIIGADKQGDMIYYDYDFSYKTAVVMGGEHKGISSLLKKNMDHLVSIPHSTKVESLNVSAAAAVILFEALRQKRIASGSQGAPFEKAAPWTPTKTFY